MILLTSYFKGHKVGLSNYLKVLFSTYRINSIICNNKQLPCVDKEFSWIFSSCFSNDNLIYNEEITNEDHGLAFDNSCVFLEDCLVAWEGTTRQYNFSSKISYNIPNIKHIYNFNENTIHKTFGWRFYVKPSDNINIKPFNNEWYLRDQPSSIDLRYNNIPKDIIKTYLNIINIFNVNKLVNKVVEEFVTKINGDFLGVHIRTWKTNGNLNDNRSSNDRYRWFLNNINNIINSINRNSLKKVLISTDNIEEIKIILPYLSNKEVFFTENSNILNEIQNDFKDILILSKSKHLIGSLNSTFSEMAWWYNGCKIPVEIF